MDITLGEKLIAIPNLKNISGTISEKVTIADERFTAEYIPALNEIYITPADGVEISKNQKIDTDISLIVGGTTVTKRLTSKITITKPNVTISKLKKIPKSKSGTEGCLAVVSITCVIKNKTYVKPLSITPISSGKSTISKVEGYDNVYKDSLTGAILTVNDDNTISISGPISGAGNISIEIKFPGDVTIKKTLSIKVDKKK